MSKEYNRNLIPGNITTKFSAESLGRLLNPFSGITGGGEQYVPEWLIKMFDDKKFVKNRMLPAKMAHILAKITAEGALFGGAAYLLRAFMHSLDIDNIESMKAGNRASQKLETTEIRPTAPVIGDDDDDDMEGSDFLVQQALEAPQTQNSRENMFKQQSYQMAVGALPPLVALASMITAFKLADKTFDTSLGNRLDRQLAEADAESKALAMNRIKKNRNIPQDTAPVQKVASLNKQAGLQAALGLLLAVVVAAGGVTGFNWHRESSPAVAKYKAYKKGLETYNKRRSLEENIENSPLSDTLVEELDSNLKGNKKTAPVASDPMNEVFV